MLEVPLNTVVVVGDSVTFACTINFADVQNPESLGGGTIIWNRYIGFGGMAIVIGSSVYEDYNRYR